MRQRTVLPLLAACAVLGACSFLGDNAVHVESGNQTTGYLTRPLMLTTSSDASVQNVAQRICDNVKPGSDAKVDFVGKVPGPGPLDLADWGKYRYECMPVASSRSVVHAPAAVSATPVAAPAVPAGTGAAPAPAVPLTSAQEQDRRQCQRQRGAYQICLGSCLATSTSASDLVEAECTQQCAPKMPAACH